MINNLLGLRRPVFRLALVSMIALLLVGASAPMALGASPTPTPKASPSPSPSASKTKPTPTPTPKTKPTPPAIKVTVPQAPQAPASLRDRTARATRQFDAALLPITNCELTISGTPPTCMFDLYARAGSVSRSAAPGLAASMPIWGFTLDDEGQGRVPGPMLIVKEGQKVWVKLLGFDERGKVRLSMKVVDQETGKEIPADKKKEEAAE